MATPTPTPGEQPKVGGTLRFANTQFPPSFDPQLLNGTEFLPGNGKLYVNLFVNYDGQVTECEICSEKGWRLEDGGKTMVFDIRPGIKFHNGQELTSADVAYSLKMLIGQIDGIASPRAGVFREYVKSIEAPSKYEVRINLIRPSTFVPKVLAVGNAAIYREGTTRDDLKKGDSGAGPFIVKAIIPGAAWQLVRNPDYFKKGQPYIDGYDETTIPDSNTCIAALLTHKTEWGALNSKTYEARLVQLESEGKVRRLVELEGSGQRAMLFSEQKPPFNDIRMRQAVNLGMDRTTIAQVEYGTTIVPGSPSLLFYRSNSATGYGVSEDKLWNVVPGWGTGAKKQEEIEQAKQLVKAAGYTNGVDVDQMAFIPISSFAPEFIQQELAKIGIRTTLSPVLQDKLQERATNLDYQIMSYNFVIFTRDPDEAVGQYWITGAGRNWTGYSNPEVDKLFILMSSEPDPVKRKDLFLQIRDIIVLKDIGHAPLVSGITVTWYWNTFRGTTLGLTLAAGSGQHRADRVWLDQ